MQLELMISQLWPLMGQASKAASDKSQKNTCTCQGKFAINSVTDNHVPANRAFAFNFALAFLDQGGVLSRALSHRMTGEAVMKKREQNKLPLARRLASADGPRNVNPVILNEQ
ncbi:hypothetical protein PoB_005119800 [Plakobranchus ocellatus]|uniref:Uncharacterized protein n=1 Tax=Plakobranchus ocellatus TaxID=259542 RepID=A0AAV4BZT9_9GAST|nr:hypothetical protein PoB_005119800 [Plakobranchus ocellatus]